MAKQEFTAPQIRRLLRLLEEELTRRGIAASLFVVGGAAIALEHNSERRTQDVDAAIVPPDAVLAAAAEVARSEQIPPSWLSANVTPWVPARGRPTLPPTEIGLRVDIAPPRTLLAMKLVASRNRDISDIRLLAEELGITDPKELADLVHAEYGDSLEMHGGYDDMLLWCQQLVNQFWGDAAI